MGAFNLGVQRSAFGGRRSTFEKRRLQFPVHRSATEGFVSLGAEDLGGEACHCWRRLVSEP
jgi:hypothetical protein